MELLTLAPLWQLQETSPATHFLSHSRFQITPWKFSAEENLLWRFDDSVYGYWIYLISSWRVIKNVISTTLHWQRRIAPRARQLCQSTKVSSSISSLSLDWCCLRLALLFHLFLLVFCFCRFPIHLRIYQSPRAWWLFAWGSSPLFCYIYQ